MSRIGKKPILIPSGVTVRVTDVYVSIKGPKGEIARTIHRDISAEVKDDALVIIPHKTSSKKVAALWGLTRSLLANMITGVTNGFEKILEFEGIGYRANLEGTTLVMQMGFSHPIRIEAPKGITYAVQKNAITIFGIDKELVGEVAARIRAIKPPEPYKGKGIHYRGEVIRRKAGKKAVASGG